MRKAFFTGLTVFFVGIFSVLIIPQSGGTFIMEKSVIAGGGSSAVGGIFILDGTIGQPLAGSTSASGTFSLQSGFWARSSTLFAAVSLTGRVSTPDGRGLRNAVIKITDPLGVSRIVTTSSLGLYSFDNVQAGQTYTMIVSSKLYRFSPLTLPVNDNLANVDFVGSE